MTQYDTLKASRPSHNFTLAARTKTNRTSIQTHPFSRHISSQTLSLLAILVEVPDVEKNSRMDLTGLPSTRIFLWPGKIQVQFCFVRLEKTPKTYFPEGPKT